MNKDVLGVLDVLSKQGKGLTSIIAVVETDAGQTTVMKACNPAQLCVGIQFLTALAQKELGLAEMEMKALPKRK